MILYSHASLLGANYRMKKLILCFITFLLVISALPAAYAEHTVACRANYNKEDPSKTVIDFADFFIFSELWGNKDVKSDLNKDGKVDNEDYFEFTNVFGHTCTHAPTLSPIGDKRVTEGQELKFEVAGSDEDGDPITLSVTSGLPTGAAFSGNTFSWTPNNDQSGSYSITLKVSDGDKFAERIVTINVNDANQAPSIQPIGNKEVIEGGTVAFDVVVSDPDKEDTSLNPIIISPLPSGATFQNKRFSWTPSSTQGNHGSKEYILSFEVTDRGSLKSTQDVKITVIDTNHPPVVTNKDPVGVSVFGNSAKLRWELSDPDSYDENRLKFDVYAYRDGAGPFAILTNWDLINWDPVNRIFSSEATYPYSQLGWHNWYVVARDTQGYETKSSVSRFLAEEQPPFIGVSVPSATPGYPDSTIRFPVVNLPAKTTETQTTPFRLVNLGDLVYFYGFGTDTDGTITGYEWDLKGAASNFNMQDNVVKLDEPGDYQISFRVKDNSNNWDPTPANFRLVVDRKPQINFQTYRGSNTPINSADNRFDVNVGEIIWYKIFASTDPDEQLMNDFVKEFRVEFQNARLYYDPYFSDSSNVVVTQNSDGVYSYKVKNKDRNFYSEVKLTFNTVGEKKVKLVPVDTFGLSGDGVELTFNVAPAPAASPSPPVVLQNNAPTANAQSVSTNEDTAKSITLTGSDSEGSALTFSIVANPTKGVLSGLNPSTGSVTYTPNANANGADSFTFKVNDGSTDSSAAAVSITVTPVNDLPVITSAAGTSATEGQPYSYDADASDVDGDSLTFSLTTNPVGMSLNSATGLISWTPSFTQSGSNNVVMQVSDSNGGTASQSFSVSVANVNGPPTISSISSQSVIENQLLQFSVSASDPDGDSFSVSASNMPTGAAFASNTFSWTPSFTQSGSYSPRFTATDSNGLSSFIDVSITVNNANRVPTADPQSQTTNEDTAKSIALTGSDLDSDPMTFSIASNPSNGALSGFNANSGAVTYTPNANFNGADSFTFKVNDGSADSSAATISLTVTAVNDAPTANTQSVSTNEDAARAITLTASDVEGSSLTFSIVTNPAKGALSGLNTATGAVTYTPNANANGADSFTFKVNDGSLDSNAAVISISINSIGDAPALNPIGAKSVIEGQLLSFTISGSDADNDALTFSASGVPSGASFDASTRTFTWSPVFTQAGAYSVTFTVSDGSSTASEIVVITVVDAGNQAPVLASIGNKVVTEGQLLSFTLSAGDPDGTTSFTYTASGMPQGANLAGNTFAWTPSFTQAGTYSVTFFASDGSAQDSETIMITVNEAGNQAPTLNVVSPQTITENQLLTFTLSGTDPDGTTTFTFSGSNIPSGAVFDPSTGVFTWTPSFTQAGTYTPTFTIGDGSLTNSKVVTINVVEAGNQPPILTVSDQIVNEGSALVFTVSPSDVDSPSLSAVTASNLPQGAAFANNEFRWTPGPTQGGVYDVSFSVNDGQLAVTRIIRITVSDVLLDDGEKKDKPASKFIDIGNVQIPGGSDFMVPGDLQMLRLELRNSANVPIDGIKVTASSDTFDLNLVKGPFTIKPGQRVVKYMDFELPEDIEPGEHYIKMIVEHNKFHKTKYAVINVV